MELYEQLRAAGSSLHSLVGKGKMLVFLIGPKEPPKTLRNKVGRGRRKFVKEIIRGVTCFGGPSLKRSLNCGTVIVIKETWPPDDRLCALDGRQNAKYWNEQESSAEPGAKLCS